LREEGKIWLWPIYFDELHTRGEGRRIPKKFSKRNPKAEEIMSAAKELGYEAEIIHDASHPKYPWIKTGVVLVDTDIPKTLLLMKIARNLKKNRGNINA
jgi:signal recognition particle subunit SRP19